LKYKELFFNELRRLMRNKGYMTEDLCSESDGGCAVIKDCRMVGRITGTGDLIPRPECGETLEDVEKLAEYTVEYVTAYSEAPPFHALGLPEGFRKLSELNRIILTAKEMKGRGFEFVTCRWDYYKRGVEYVQYFYEYSAKKNFAERSGLLNQ